jgi:hypothetical protein
LDNLIERNKQILFLYTSKPKIRALIESLTLYYEKEILKQDEDAVKLPEKLIKKAAMTFWILGETFFTTAAPGTVYDPNTVRVTIIPDSTSKRYEVKDRSGNFTEVANCIHIGRFTDPHEIRGISIINLDGSIKLFNKNHFIEAFIETIKI